MALFPRLPLMVPKIGSTSPIYPGASTNEQDAFPIRANFHASIFFHRRGVRQILQPRIVRSGEFVVQGRILHKKDRTPGRRRWKFAPNFAKAATGRPNFVSTKGSEIGSSSSRLREIGRKLPPSPPVCDPSCAECVPGRRTRHFARFVAGESRTPRR